MADHLLFHLQRIRNMKRLVSRSMPKVAEPIDYPVNVKAVFYMQTKRKVDLTNLHEALHDILVKYGVLEDDNFKIIQSTDGSRVSYDKWNPRTEVEITRAGDDIECD